jgi:hypothetical protein
MDKSLPFSRPLLFARSPSGSSSFPIGAIPNGSKLDRLLLFIGQRRRNPRFVYFGRGGLPLFGREVVDTP